MVSGHLMLIVQASVVLLLPHTSRLLECMLDMIDERTN